MERKDRQCTSVNSIIGKHEKSLLGNIYIDNGIQKDIMFGIFINPELLKDLKELP